MTEQPADTETRMDRLERKLDQLLAGGQAKAQAHQAEHLDRPTEVQEQVRMELERAEQEKSDKAARDGEKAERETMAQRLARLEEQAPLPPQPRRQRIMWGAR
jgi:hypothetical protein